MIMQLVDTHCHLESSLYRGHLDDIIAGAKKAGISALITSSIEPGQWEQSLSLAEKYDIVHCSLGIHPWYIREQDIPALDSLGDMAHRRGAVAVGEIGLDSNVDRPDFNLQRRVFEQQLAIAKEIDLPVIIHCRGAFNELLVAIKRTGLPERGGTVHSFSGSAEIAEELMKYGLSFSLGGILTYRNSRKREKMMGVIYPDHFLLETDSPDIPPIEAKGSLHVPANILYNLKAAAEILCRPEEEVARQTTKNAARIFNLSL